MNGTNQSRTWIPGVDDGGSRRSSHPSRRLPQSLLSRAIRFSGKTPQVSHRCSIIHSIIPRLVPLYALPRTARRHNGHQQRRRRNCGDAQEDEDGAGKPVERRPRHLVATPRSTYREEEKKPLKRTGCRCAAKQMPVRTPRRLTGPPLPLAAAARCRQTPAGSRP